MASADLSPNEHNTPVYRIRSPYGGYLLTMDRKERDIAIINYGYYNEGVSFYALRWSSKPVFRMVNPGDALRFLTNSSLERDVALRYYGYLNEGVSFYSY